MILFASCFVIEVPLADDCCRHTVQYEASKVHHDLSCHARPCNDVSPSSGPCQFLIILLSVHRTFFDLDAEVKYLQFQRSNCYLIMLQPIIAIIIFEQLCFIYSIF